MKRYWIGLTVLTVDCALIMLLLFIFARHLFLPASLVMTLYFGVVTAVQHSIVISKAQKDARDFIRTFLGIIVATLVLHIVVLFSYDFTHLDKAKIFTLSFSILFLIFNIFEMVSLYLYINRQRKEYQEQNKEEH